MECEEDLGGPSPVTAKRYARKVSICGKVVITRKVRICSQNQSRQRNLNARLRANSCMAIISSLIQNPLPAESI